MTECTHEDCTNDAEFALLIGGEFSTAHRPHTSSEHEQGDLHPFVCPDHRPLYAEMFQIGELRRPSDA